MADFDDEMWTCEVESLSKINPDPDDPEDGVAYAVVFNALGPNASAEVEVFVDGSPDPMRIVALALSHLHVALAGWARVTAGQHIANDDGEA